MIDKQNEEKRKRLIVGWLAFMILAGALVAIGLSLVFEYMPQAWAINATAIDEVQTQLASEIAPEPAFHIAWLIILLIIMCAFMVTTFIMREDRETIYFSIGALIVSIVLALMLTSPLPFDLQETHKSLEIVANDTQVIQATVKHDLNQTIILPGDSEFRLILSLLFTGNSLFLGLYTLYILTDFKTKGKW